MCHEHSRAETAHILETMADLFAWRRRARLVEAAAVLRGAEPHRRQGAAEDRGGDQEWNPALVREPGTA